MVDSQPCSSSDRARTLDTSDEEEEESEAKLREAIEVLEGATFVIAGSWRDFWGAIF